MSQNHHSTKSFTLDKTADAASRAQDIPAQKTTFKLMPVADLKRTKVPTVMAPVIDRLAFILPWNHMNYEDSADRLLRMHSRVETEINSGLCEKAFLTGSRYRINFRIMLPSGATPLVQIGARDPSVQHCGIRVELNPAMLKSGDLKQFRSSMRRIVGDVFPRLMRSPLLNRIDIAVEVCGVEYGDLLVHYKRARRFTMFGKQIGNDARLETINFGSVTSDYVAAAYDKRQEQRHAAIEEILRVGIGSEPLTSNLIRQYHRTFKDEPRLRVEVRGKKMRGLPLADLETMPNRFSWFEFVDLAARQDSGGAGLSELGRKSLIAMWRQNGATAALDAFKHTPEARAAHAFVRARKATWWNPEPMWRDACTAIRDLGLFPAEAFHYTGA